MIEKDIYSDLSGQDIMNIEPCRNRQFGNLGGCTFIGEYQTLTAWMPPLGDDEATCLNWGYSNTDNTTGNVALELMSFPFGKNTPRSIAATNLTGTNQRVLTIQEHLLPIERRGYYALSSSWFTKSYPADDLSEEEEDNQTHTPNTNEKRTIVPHAVIRHKIYATCNNEPIDIVRIIIDNTRGRARYYPFLNCNEFSDPTCSSDAIHHDISIIPFVNINTTDGEPPENFEYLNYFPFNEAPECSAFSCLTWDGVSPDPDPCTYMYPAPYSLIGVHIRNGASPVYPLGYVVDGEGELQPQEGIKHTYIVDKNFDITQINPSERIFYNPSEVHIEADNLIFPSGYSFVTARGTPPTLTDIDNTPCAMKNSLDQRYMPVITDQPNTYYIKADGTPKEVRPAVYILEPGSKLTIEPCVHLYDMTIVVKPGARLIYYPNQLYGNFDPANDIITDGEVPPSAITAINYQGACHDCRCEQEYYYENNTDITADETWQDRIMHIKGVIRVKSGVKLEIKNSRLYFADADYTSQQSGIHIEPGAKVIIDRSLLTTLTCHKNWDGIVVEGNPNLPQWPQTNQGVLQIANSTLEKARTGITALKWFNWGGGIVWASNTVFKNNNVSFIGGLYQHPSASYFNNCAFQLTKAHSGCFLAQVVLINNQNIHFRDCTFKNSLGYGNDCYEAANDERIAILAYQSDFYVGPMFPVAPNPNVVSTQSIISGFNKGVDTYGTIEWGARATIWRTRFENNFYGFVANGSNLDQITESTFEDNIYNTFFHYATNYTLAGNTFRNINPNTLNGFDFGYGAVSHQSAGGSRIFANTFNNLYQGVTIEGNNTDLQIKCNNFSNFAASGIDEYRYPWFINDITVGTYEPAVLGNQGIGCDQGQSAGNLFYDAGQVHIYAAAPVSFWYFANGTPSTTIPNKAGDADLIEVENCTNPQQDINNCPDLPNLNGFEGMTGVGNGSPEDLANDIRNNSVSDNELSVRTTRAVQYYLQQDSTQQQAIEFLTELDTREAKTMLLGAHLQQGDTAMVRHYRLLLQADTAIHPNLKDYYKVLEAVVKDGRNVYDLTGQEAADFEALAESGGLSTNAYIQSLLAMPRLQTYYRVPQPVNQSSKRPNQLAQRKQVSWLYPNPATNTINIASHLQWKNAVLYNLLGKAVAGYTSENNRLLLPENLQNGIYIVQLTLDNGQTQTAKLFISK